MRPRWLALFSLAALPLLLSAQEQPSRQTIVLSLAQAVRLALSAEGNMGLQSAIESVRVAEAKSRAARTELLPTAEFSTGVQNQVMNLNALGFESIQVPVAGFHFPDSAGPFNLFDSRVRVRQSLLDVAASRRVNAMRATVETATTEVAGVRDRVAAEVARAYVAVVRAELGIEASRSSITLVEAALEEARNRREAGQALALDVTRVQSRLTVARARLLDHQMQRELAALQLLRLLNRGMDTPIELSDRLTSTVDEPVTLEQALAAALRSRAEIGRQQKLIEESERSDLAIHAERLPTIAAYADGGALGTTLPKSVGTYSIGVSVKVPVFDGGRREARRAEVQAEIHRERLRAADLKQQVEVEVRQALFKLKLARQQVDLANDAVTLSREELARTQRRYDAGIGGQMELFESKANLASAVASHADAICAWHQTHIDLLEAIGDIARLT